MIMNSLNLGDFVLIQSTIHFTLYGRVETTL